MAEQSRNEIPLLISRSIPVNESTVPFVYVDTENTLKKGTVYFKIQHIGKLVRSISVLFVLLQHSLRLKENRRGIDRYEMQIIGKLIIMEYPRRRDEIKLEETQRFIELRPVIYFHVYPVT